MRTKISLKSLFRKDVVGSIVPSDMGSYERSPTQFWGQDSLNVVR